MEEAGNDDAYVLVELTGVIDAEGMEMKGKSCQILGVDTAEPVLKLGSYLFTGEYKDVVGTCVLFEDTSEPGEPSASPTVSKSPKKLLNYFAKTEKKLEMKTSFLQEKAQDPVGETAAEGVDT